MSAPDVVDEARRWLRYAAEDLDAAERLLGNEPSRHACWLAQQAAEKALKGALVLEEVDFPFSHDLDALRNLLSSSWPIHRECADLARLTQWTTEARYPGEWQEATPVDAERAVAQAGEVCNSITAEFERRTGVETEGDSIDDGQRPATDVPARESRE